MEEEGAPSTPHSASPASSTPLSDPRQTAPSPDRDTDSPLIGFTEEAAPDHHCPYCHKAFRLPRLLHCLHALCEDCIIALLEGHNTGVDSPNPSGHETPNCLEEELEPSSTPKSKPPPGVIRCPVCRQDSQIGNDARFAHMLLLDHVRINLMDASAVRSSDMACESCKTKDKAVARCEDCTSFLCGNCVQAHQFMRCFEGHSVVGLEELRTSDGTLVHRPIPCTPHGGQPLQFYCSSCDSPVCKDCILSDHSGPGHSCHRIDEATGRALREQLDELVSMGTAKADYCQKLSGDLESGIATLRDNVDGAREMLDEEFAKYAALLEERRVMMVSQLDALAERHEEHIRETSKAFCATAERLQDACEFTERLLKYGSGMEVLVTRKAVLRQLQTLVHAAPSPNAPTNLHFVSDTKVYSQALEAYAGAFKSDLIQPGFSGAGAGGVDPWKNDINSLLRRLTRPPLPNPLPLNPAALPPPNYVDPGPFPYPASNPPPLHPPPKAQGEQPSMAALAAALAMMQPNGNYNAPPANPAPSTYNPPGYQPPTSTAYPPTSFAGGFNSFTSSSASFNPPSSGSFTSSSASFNPPTSFPNGGFGAPQAPPQPAFFRSPSATLLAGPPDPVHVPTSSAFAPPVVTKGTAVGSGRESTQPSQAPTPTTVLPPPGFSPFADSGTPFASSGGLLASLSSSSPMEGGLKSGTPGKTQPMQIRNKFGSLGQAQSQFNSPHGFCLGPDEEIVVADTNNHRIQVFLKDGTFKFQFGVPGKEEGQCWYPRKVAVIRHPEPRFVVCDRGSERSRMQIFNKNGQFLKRIGIKYVDIVAGLAIDQQRQQIVAVDSVSPTVFRISEAGEPIKWFSVAQYMKEPSDIAVSGGEYYICDFKGHSVCVFSEEGVFNRRIGSEKLTSFPNGIDISNQGDVLIGDSHGNRFHVSVFRKNGDFESEFDCPYVKVSRCCGLRITEEGFLVTLAKNNHHVLVLNTLYLP